jgi:O-antigen/teichoic acid export membrane protein
MITIYNVFIGMSMQTNISRLFFKISKGELSKYIGNILIILGFTFGIYFLITFVLTFFIDSIFSIPSKWILLVPIISVLLVTNELNLTILRNENRAYMYGIFENLNTILKVTLTVLFLIVFSMSWHSQVLSMLISGLVFFVVALVYMYKRGYISIIFDSKKIKSILNISIPLIPHLLGSLIIAMSDRLFIEHMVGLEAVGIYSVAYMFGMTVVIVTDSFIKAWSPWFYKTLSSPTQEKKKKIVKYTYLYIFIVFILAVFISLFANFIMPYFVDSKFYGAKEFVLWIALGYAIQGVYKIFFPYLVHINKTSFLGFSTLMAALFNLIFNYFFIKEFGTIGAAYATMLAFSISAGLVFWYQRKNYSMPWFIWSQNEKV